MSRTEVQHPREITTPSKHISQPSLPTFLTGQDSSTAPFWRKLAYPTSTLYAVARAVAAS
jgi:hypothetical protein